jgi:stearoyl-CoA desaturase (delta-9 desaturase)
MDPLPAPDARRFTALRALSLSLFIAMHLGSLAVLWLGGTWADVALCAGLYVLRMFGITAGYHRYFAHRAYKTSRWFQFVLAWIGSMSIQKGVLWWAGLHRVHHRWSDTPRDLHSPVQRGLLYAHAGWFVSPEHDETDMSLIPDFAKYPELRWLNTYYWVPALVMAAACYALDGARGVVWGAGLSTVLLWHGTFTINSLSHTWGSRRYETTDTSRNNFILALITLGEGWHNNHHHYMNSANQGFFWWEVDVSYYVLRALAAVGVVRDLRKPPAHVLSPGLVAAATTRLAGVKAAAETRFAEAREAVGEVKAVAETRLAEAREAVGEVKAAAETRFAEAREAVESAVEDASTAKPSATS